MASRRAGYQVCVAAPASGPLAEALRSEGVEIVPFELRDAKGVRFPLAELRRKLAEILRRHRPALLHANSLAMGRLSGPVAAELALPSLSHLRDIVTLSRQAIADLNCHSRLLAVSEATRQFHVAQGLAGEKTHVLYNGIDLERFRPRPPTGYLHQQLGLTRDVPLIGTIGQISLRKGHDVLAAALANDDSPRTSGNALRGVPYSRGSVQHGTPRPEAVPRSDSPLPGSSSANDFPARRSRGSSKSNFIRLPRGRWPGGSTFSVYATTCRGFSTS